MKTSAGAPSKAALEVSMTLSALLFAAWMPLAAAASQPDVAPPASGDDAALIEQIRAQDPDRAAILERLAETDPDAYTRALRSAVQRHGDRAESPEMEAARDRLQAVDQALRTQARAIADAPEAERDALRQDMATLAGEAFDLRQQMRRAHLAQLQARAATLEAEIAQREATRDDIIGAYVAGSLGDVPRGL